MDRYIDEISDIIERVEAMIEDAEELNAIKHKLQEALGPLYSAQGAAEQYVNGTLYVNGPRKVNR